MSAVARRQLGAVRRGFATLASLEDRTPVIVSYARTPIGRFNGALGAVSATKLGAVAVRGAVERAGLCPTKDGEAINEAFMGNVCAAGVGQAPVTQAIIFAGLPDTINGTTVHKVCSSGMKTIMFAADSIRLGRSDICIAGGMESMSNVPHYLKSLRGGVRLGEGKLLDGLVHDGLWDVYKNIHMGSCAEICADGHDITREAQDAFAKASYERALAPEAIAAAAEAIVPVEVPKGRGKSVTVSTDEEPGAGRPEKIPALRPAFKRNGTVTAANASKLNDGAAAVVVMSAAEARKRGVKPLAVIRGYGDAQGKPEWFTTAPSKAVPIAIEDAGLKPGDMQLHEVNEAFSVVALANMKILGLNHDEVNIWGGAVALGHPIGVSGTRIVGQLAQALKAKGKKYGTASICNGGGGASAMVLEAIE